MKRYFLSNWRIRTRLIALLILPVLTALILGGFRIQTSVQTQQDLTKVSQLGQIANSATLLATALENERDTMAGLLTATGDPEDDAIVSAWKLTDTRRTAFNALTAGLNQSELPGNGVDVLDITRNLQQIGGYRSTSFKGKGTNILQSVNQYDSLIQPLLSLSQDVALASSNEQLVQSTRALEEFSKWKEDMSIVRAVLSAGLAAKQPLNSGDLAYGASALTNSTSAKDAFTQLYGPGVAAAQTLTNSWSNNINVQRAQQFSSAVLGSSDGFSAVSAENLPTFSDWNAIASTQIQQMGTSESVLVQGLNQQTSDLRSQAQTDAVVNAVLIGLVLLVAVAGAAIVARSMVRTLSKLQHAAEDVAENRLPELVRALSDSDPQDIDTSVAPIDVNTTDEIGHVARAFDQVHAQAVRLASEQALLRGNINAMFTNLSRRSQGLIQRQLSMISELESREADPDQLASLFKLDHLATRMRRNGENLLVLAGEDPGRRWTRPVPLVDVLRAAASEVEQYERIELASVPTADVAGRVVNDLVHLLAELLENATSFSSPQTRVRVTGHALPDGRVLVEIHDTGIGLSPEDLAEINERLANPPVVDVSVSRRMGLFVVGRLSLRHGIRIQLRPSDSGGTTALVMLPVDVTNAAERRGGQQGPGQQRQQGAVPGGMSSQGLPGQGGQGRGPQQRGPVAPPADRPPVGAGPAGRPSLSQQPGGPRRGGNAPGLPQGSSPMGGQSGAPTGPVPSREPQRPQPAQAQAPQQQPTPQPQRQAPPQQQPQQPPQQSGFGQRPQAAVPPQSAQPSSMDDHNMWAEQPQHGSPAGRPQPANPDSTVQFARPHFEEEPARPIPQQQPQPTRPMAPQPQSFAPQQQPAQPQQQMFQQQQMALPPAPADPANHPLTRALPPAEAGAGSSPIFEAMESNWFRSGRADRMRAVQVYGESAAAQAAEAQAGGAQNLQGQAPQYRTPEYQSPQQAPQYPSSNPQRSQPPAAPYGEQSLFGAPPQRPMPQRGFAAEGMPSGATAADPWRASANDEVWRRAEQVKEPSAGGVLPSGLPRRVPKANLVPGMAESAPAEGPQVQVSRSPDEVRGRLTNLRRGVQQGRQAGTANPNQGNDPYGTNPQER